MLHFQDIYAMKTPGGGGYGPKSSENQPKNVDGSHDKSLFLERGSVYEYRQAQESV